MTTTRRYPVIVLDRVTAVNGFTTDKEMDVNSLQKMGVTVSKLKNEGLCLMDSSNVISNNRVEDRTTVGVKNKSGIFGLRNNTSSVWVEVNSLTKLAVEVKKEKIDNSEITWELVEDLPCHLDDALEIPLHSLKTEICTKSEEDEYCESYGAENRFDLPASDASVREDNSEKLCTPSSIFCDSRRVKFVTVSVVLDDLFSVSARKLGKAHSSGGLCLCIYCSGEYKYVSDSSRRSGSYERERSSSLAQSNHKFRKNAGLKIPQRKEKGKMQLKCSLCPKKFAERYDLPRPFCRSYCAERSFACHLCPAKFKWRRSLSYHSKVHSTERPFSCKLCSSTFKLRSILNAHLRIHTGEKPFSCNLCSKRFLRRNDLKEHMISVHSNEKLFSCEHCSATFKLKRHLICHTRIHTGEKPFSCDLCSKTFSHGSSLKIHMISKHSNERKFKCEHCSLTFKLKSVLINHVRIHTGEKPFRCNICSQTFTQSSTLKKHTEYKHSNEKTFICEHCPATYKSRVGLHYHLSIHTGQKPFSCKRCSKTFPLRNALKMHMKCVHGIERPFRCNFCPAAFKWRNSLNAHERTHSSVTPFECDLCSAKFKHNSDWRRHSMVHSSERPFSCKHCSSTFKLRSSLNIHMRVHTGEKPFKCEQCSSTFKLKRYLKVHIGRHHSGKKSF